MSRGGEILQYQILYDVDAAAGQEDQMPRHHAPEFGISEPNHVPRHVVRPDRKYLPVSEPVRGARGHSRSCEVAFFNLPVAAVAGPDEHHIAGLDVCALLLAAVLQILRRDGVAWLELIGALARGHVEEDSGGQDRGYLLDAESLEAARALDAAVHGDVAEERQGIRLMAKRVDVGPCVLCADDDAGGPSARPCFFGPVLVFVAAVQVVGVAGLPMGGVDGHAFRAGLLQVEDACADHHTGVLSFCDRKSSGRTVPPRTPGLRATGRAVGRGSGGGFGLPAAGLPSLLHILREINVSGLRSPRRPDADQDGAYDQEGERSVLEGHDLLQASLVVGIERREDDRQTVAKPETRSTHAGVEALVYVGGRKAPGPDDQGYDHSGKEDDQEEALRCGAYEQIVHERAHDRHDETSD